MIHPLSLLDADAAQLDLPDASPHLNRLDLHGRAHFDVVIDTDPYNEVDDQFALAYALLSPERMSVEAIYAAPFHNRRSLSPADGMHRSFNEIGRVLSYLPGRFSGEVCRGALGFLEDVCRPFECDAVNDLIARGMAPRSSPLYVIGIAALTNVASALLLEPRLADRIVVLWLGGQPSAWHTAHEFNLRQDPVAARVVLDCGVPLIRIPCLRVAQSLEITPADVEAAIGGAGPFGRYLSESVRSYLEEIQEPAKVIWDISAVAALISPTWVPTSLVRNPVLTDRNTWEFDRNRHLGREAYAVDRECVLNDLWSKLSRTA